MDPLALAAAVSILTAIVALGVAVATVPANVQARSRLELAISGASSGVLNNSVDPLRTRKRLGFLQFFVSGGWLIRTQRDLRLADSHLQPTDLLAIRAALAALAFAVPFIFPGGIPGLIVGVVAGAAGFQLPQFWLKHAKSKRRNKLEAQLPEALTMLANSLKAGFGLMQAMNMAADEPEHPIGTELGMTVHETNVGSSTEEAFLALSERNENYDLDIVVTAVLVQRTAGGNLARGDPGDRYPNDARADPYPRRDHHTYGPAKADRFRHRATARRRGRDVPAGQPGLHYRVVHTDDRTRHAGRGRAAGVHRRVNHSTHPSD